MNMDRARAIGEELAETDAQTSATNNLTRALQGRDLAEAALLHGTEWNRMGTEDFEAGLCDALTNLLHFAHRYEIDFAEELATAHVHFAAEKLSEEGI